MSGYETLSLAAGATGTGLVLLSTISSTIIILATLLSPKKTNVLAKGARYEDADGVATEESTAAFSVTLPKTVICLLTVAGLGISIALAIIDTLNHDKYFIEAWLNAAAWVCLFSRDARLYLQSDKFIDFPRNSSCHCCHLQNPH
jgi:hypothetical protein